MDRSQLAQIAAGATHASLILVSVSGAHLYGFDSPDSDIDLRGTHLLPLPELVGLDAPSQTLDRSWVEDGLEIDPVSHDLANNPNMLALLWANENHILYMDEYGAELRAHRELFLSQQVARAYAGYAENQLQRMETHYRWLHQPPTHASWGGFRIVNCEGRGANYKPATYLLFPRYKHEE